MNVYSHGAKKGWVALSDTDIYGPRFWGGATWAIELVRLDQARVYNLKLDLVDDMPPRFTAVSLDEARRLAVPGWRQAWFHFCDQAATSPDTTRTIDDLAARYEKESGHWVSPGAVGCLIKNYEASRRFEESAPSMRLRRPAAQL